MLVSNHSTILISEDSKASTKYRGFVVDESMSLEEKLSILSDAAKYDVACTSSGVDRQNDGNSMGNSKACGICHTFASDGRCVSLLKILMTNECIYNCKYCINRSSNDIKRATFTPQEICRLTMEFYRRNYIEGLFLSSGIIHSPDYTMDLIFQVLYLLRIQHKFHGYIHIKAIPGTDPSLIEQIGYFCDRMSVNLELPTGSGLKKLAPHKNRANILSPMKHIQVGIQNSKQNLGITNKYEHISMNSSYYSTINTDTLQLKEDLSYLSMDSKQNEFSSNPRTLSDEKTMYDFSDSYHNSPSGTLSISSTYGTANKYFVPAGQSTQMIIGATDENDYQILMTTESLYENFGLKRVFYSAYIPLNEDSSLPSLDTKPPLLREHRLYQADWLLRFYGFQAAELLSPDKPSFNTQIDPKCDWAVRHLDKFPMEIMKAGYYELLRVPGIGVKSARRIISARRSCKLSFQDLKKIGVVLKRAQYFITCNGRMLYSIPFEEKFITNQLIYGEKPFLPATNMVQFTQPTLFDMGLS